MDIAVANSAKSNVNIFLGYSNGSFARQITYSTGNRVYPYAVTISDFDSDNNMDIAIVNYGQNEGNILNIIIGVLLNLGNGTFTSAVMYSTGYNSLSNSIASGDFNNDKK
ncbi:unnamed protein product, partial [Rotaria sp. Silwood2]